MSAAADVGKVERNIKRNGAPKDPVRHDALFGAKLLARNCCRESAGAKLPRYARRARSAGLTCCTNRSAFSSEFSIVSAMNWRNSRSGLRSAS